MLLKSSINFVFDAKDYAVNAEIDSAEDRPDFYQPEKNSGGSLIQIQENYSGDSPRSDLPAKSISIADDPGQDTGNWEDLFSTFNDDEYESFESVFGNNRYQIAIGANTGSIRTRNSTCGCVVNERTFHLSDIVSLEMVQVFATLAHINHFNH